MKKIKDYEIRLEENEKQQLDLLSYHLENPEKEVEVTLKMNVLGAEYHALQTELHLVKYGNKNDFKESEVQKRAKFNKFEEEMREWSKVYQDIYGYEILDGTVSDVEGKVSLKQHNNAKLSKGDIGLKFGELEFYISQKLSKWNKFKSTVPGRVTFPLPTINYRDMKNRQKDFLILDTNEVKELRNGKGFKYLIYKDENYGGYYLYCKNDLQKYQSSEFYLEPEGGTINLQEKYNVDTFHKFMSKEEGEPKRKNVIQRTFLRFDSLEECMKWFMKFVVEYELDIHKRQQKELRDPRFHQYKKELVRWVKQNKNNLFYSPIIAVNRLVILGKQDVLIRVSDTPKDCYNDEIVSEYDLFSYELLKLRDKFSNTEKFMDYLIGTYAVEDFQQETECMLKSYNYKGKPQEFVKIVAPSSFYNKKTDEWSGKCPGATRKEAITCHVRYEIGKVKLVKANMGIRK